MWLHFQIYPNYRKKKKFGEVQQPGDVGLSPELCYLFSLIPDGLVGLAFNIFIHVLQRQEQRGWIKGLVMVWGEERDGESVREREYHLFLSLSRISVVTKLKLNPLKSKTIWPGSYFRPGLEVRLRLQRFSLVVLKILNAIPLPVITKKYYPRQEDILPKDFGRVCITKHFICTNFAPILSYNHSHTFFN